MDNLSGVQVGKGKDDAGKEEAGLFLSEFSAISEVIPEISSVTVVHDEEESLPILEGGQHVDQEGMFGCSQ